MRLSKNFTLKELCKSSTALSLGLKNEPNELEQYKLELLAKLLLQPLRVKYGAITINSGFRCKELNKAIGGVPTSFHTKGCAADCNFRDTSLDDVYAYIKNCDLPFTECIYYKSRNFIHLALDLTSSKKLAIVK